MKRSAQKVSTGCSECRPVFHVRGSRCAGVDARNAKLLFGRIQLLIDVSSLPVLRVLKICTRRRSVSAQIDWSKGSLMSFSTSKPDGRLSSAQLAMSDRTRHSSCGSRKTSKATQKAATITLWWKLHFRQLVISQSMVVPSLAPISQQSLRKR